MPQHRIANVYSGLRHLLGMSQLHAPAAFPFDKEVAWDHSRSYFGREGKKYHISAGIEPWVFSVQLATSLSQDIASHYT
jgi:hypothetical protein